MAKIVLDKADGMLLVKETDCGMFVNRLGVLYRVCTIDGLADSRNRSFVRKGDAVKYFKEITADYSVKDNTLEESTKTANLIFRR
jgi:hypothetical protein